MVGACRLGPRQVIEVGTVNASEGSVVSVKITPRAHGDRTKVWYRLNARVDANEIEGITGAFAIVAKVPEPEPEPEPEAGETSFLRARGAEGKPEAGAEKKKGLFACCCP